jgi:abequosyltransferase
MNSATRHRLSICIATYNRASYIRETLDTFMTDLPDDVQVLIVDGASTDGTAEVVAEAKRSYPRLKYLREETNSGIDRDYDKAVAYADGDYCWLMTDDDLLVAGAVRRVLDVLDSGPELLVVNAEVRSADLSRTLNKYQLPPEGKMRYGAEDLGELVGEAGAYLSFIGAVVVRRATWLARPRESYYGTLFIHVGTLLQAPALASIVVIRDPLIVIRYGNAMWTARGFEIWMFKWPALIWSFSHLPESSKAAVTRCKPYRSPKRLLWYRAIGGYSPVEFRSFIRPRLGPLRLAAAWLIAWLPSRIANGLVGLACQFRVQKLSPIGLYDLARAPHASAISRAVARRKGLL